METTKAEPQWDRIRAAEKTVHTIVARDFSASRMNATKWRETIEVLSNLCLNYRFQWVHEPDISNWGSIWIPYPGSTYFDTNVGPFRTFAIEWLEVDPKLKVSQGLLIEPEYIDYGTEVERRLDQINVPYEWVDDHIRIVGYVRNG